MLVHEIQRVGRDTESNVRSVVFRRETYEAAGAALLE